MCPEQEIVFGNLPGTLAIHQEIYAAWPASMPAGCADSLQRGRARFRASVRRPRAIPIGKRFRGVAQVASDLRWRPMPHGSPPDKAHAVFPRLAAQPSGRLVTDPRIDLGIDLGIGLLVYLLLYLPV